LEISAKAIIKTDYDSSGIKTDYILIRAQIEPIKSNELRFIIGHFRQRVYIVKYACIKLKV